MFLFGCDFLQNNNSIEFEIQNNITIAISQYDNYDWSKVIKIRQNGKILNFSNATVTLLDGQIKVGETCKHKVSYRQSVIETSEVFYVKIINDEHKIKDTYNLSNNTTLAVCGTVSLINEVGFILTDETGSIFINYTGNDITKGNTVYVEGKYQFNNGHEILLSNYTITNSKTEISVPTNLTDSEYINLATSFHLASIPKYINVIAFVEVVNNNVLLKVGTNYIEVSSNALEDKTNLLLHSNKLISISGWVYKSNSANLLMMIDSINYVYESNSIIGTLPVIEISSSYYFYTDIKNVHNLSSYFSIYDKEDGKITITNDMINGSISVGQNIISATVIDSDLNKVTTSIIIEVNDYTTTNTNESIKILDEYATPSTGDVDVLVIPVSFPNHPATTTMLKNIEKGFFGTEQDTGWESLASYYLESSYGKLNISGDVTDWYTPKMSQSYYAKYSDGDNYIYGSTILLEEALTYFKNDYDYSKYDSNDDGYIDAVYLIYNTPVGGNKTLKEQEFYWAFTYWDTNADSRNYAETKAYSYVFMGYDFFMEDLMYNTKDIAINAETVIHETGHLLNLADYYDYDDYDKYSNDGGYCAVDMMDYNIGDHGPYSKILLDWIDPVVIYKSGIYELPAFSTSGITFLINANNSFNTIFDEYYLIDFYTFDGLNNMEIKSFFNTNNNYAGVRISHVNSYLTYKNGYFPIFTYNNSDTKYKQIKMLEADYNGKFHMSSSKNDGAVLKDFYQVGDSFGTGYYANYKSYDGNPLPFTMEVLSMNDDYATIKINFK